MGLHSAKLCPAKIISGNSKHGRSKHDRVDSRSFRCHPCRGSMAMSWLARKVSEGETRSRSFHAHREVDSPQDESHSSPFLPWMRIADTCAVAQRLRPGQRRAAQSRASYVDAPAARSGASSGSSRYMLRLRLHTPSGCSTPSPLMLTPSPHTRKRGPRRHAAVLKKQTLKKANYLHGSTPLSPLLLF
eukprot:3357444-Rhodomonas_salina.3